MIAVNHPRWSSPPRLVAGERVRDIDTRVEYVVERVTPCSATLREAYARPKTVTVPDGAGGTRTFQASAGSARLQVSPFSFMERVR